MFCLTKLVNRLILPQSPVIPTTPLRLGFMTSSFRTREFSLYWYQKGLQSVPLFQSHRLGLQKLHCLMIGSAGYHYHNMSYFVIGVSGVTCGGKTTMSKLIQRSFPWSRVIHQDKYFYPEDYPGHVRLPEIGDHINFDLQSALDMAQMHKDVDKILRSPPKIQNFIRNGEIAPNFAEGLELLRNVTDLDKDTARYSGIPILIIEGFTMYESEDLYDKCDIRFFLTLDEETCRHRRSLRFFDPPDGEGYFDHCIWPEYQKHYKHFIHDRDGIHVLSGKAQIGTLWNDSIELIMQKMEENFAYKLNKAKENF